MTAPTEYRTQGFSLPADLVDEIRDVSRLRNWSLSLIGREAFRMWLDQYHRTGSLTAPQSIEPTTDGQAAS